MVAGEGSLHKTWGKGDYDLAVISRYSDKFENDGKFYHRAEGSKWQCILSFACSHLDQLENYEQIWCPDDDIATDGKTITEMFKLFKKYELKLASPSITEDSYYFFPVTIHNKDFCLRFMNMVDISFPIFRRDVFNYLSPTFDIGKGEWALCWVWSKEIKYDKVAVIDEIQVKRTSSKYKNDGSGDEFSVLRKNKIYSPICIEIDKKYSKDYTGPQLGCNLTVDLTPPSISKKLKCSSRRGTGCAPRHVHLSERLMDLRLVPR